MSIGVFYTRYASEIESDPVGEYTRATMVLEELGINPDDVTVDDFRYNNRLERYMSIYFFSIRLPIYNYIFFFINF